MIEVIEMTAPDGTPIEGATCPPEIAACGEGAPAYLIVDLSQGSPQGRASVEDEIRRGYKLGASIIFVGNHKLADGRIVSVGKKIDPMIARMGMMRRDLIRQGLDIYRSVGYT